MTYHASGAPPAPWNDRLRMVMNDGTWHEELTKDWIRKSGFTLHSEQWGVHFDTRQTLAAAGWVCGVCDHPVAPFEVHGHIDGIVTDLLGKDTLLEHKAIDHFRCDAIWKGALPLDNLTQTALYSRGAQRWASGLERWVLLIKNRNTTQLMEFTGTYDVGSDVMLVEEAIRSDGERKRLDHRIENVTQAAVNKLAAVERMRAAGEMPVRPFEFGGDYPCSYCRWGAACWDGYAKELLHRAKGVALGAEADREALEFHGLSVRQGAIEKERKVLGRVLRAKLEAAGASTGVTERFLLSNLPRADGVPVLRVVPKKGEQS
jgi:hypothetical protein